jgi:hypothetical protein
MNEGLERNINFCFRLEVGFFWYSLCNNSHDDKPFNFPVKRAMEVNMREGTVISDNAAVLIVLIVFAVVIGLMLACGPRYAIVWDKPGATQQEFAKDKYECMQEAQQTRSAATGAYCSGYVCVPGQAESKVVTNPTLFSSCMEARGYTSRKVKQGEQ